MSLGNPSVRTCIFCDKPPEKDWPAPQLCEEHEHLNKVPEIQTPKRKEQNHESQRQ